jgi:hypothetical protein
VPIGSGHGNYVTKEIGMINQFSKTAGTVIVGLMLFASPTMVAAADLAKPVNEVVLTVSGAISNTNLDNKAAFDIDMLKALPTTTFKTRTTWTEGEKTFTGVSMQALLAAVGSTGTVAKSIALNDYGIEIPVSDAVADGPIVAYLMDGVPMPVRDKGPLWIVYPFDAKPEYRTEATYAKSIWQLSRIEIK